MLPIQDEKKSKTPTAQSLRSIADRVRTERDEKDHNDSSNFVDIVLESSQARARDGQYKLEIINVQWRNIVQPLSEGAREIVTKTLMDLGYKVSWADHLFVLSWEN